MTPSRRARHDERRPWTVTALIVVTAVVVGLVAAGFGAYAVHRSTPTYTSQALLEIDQPQAIAASSDEGVVAKLGRLRLKYAGLVRTQVFSGPVAEQLGLPPGLVAGSLYALADQQSLLLAIGARTHDPDKARLIAQAASQYLSTYVRDEQTRNGIPAAQQITFNIATPATAAHQIAPTRRREVLVAAFVFIFAAGAVAGLALAGRRRDI
jgi:capsular polysaccharide biosynthesis protein